MSCSQCRHEFCWLCLGSWKDHGEGAPPDRTPCTNPVPPPSLAAVALSAGTASSGGIGLGRCRCCRRGRLAAGAWPRAADAPGAATMAGAAKDRAQPVRATGRASTCIIQCNNKVACKFGLQLRHRLDMIAGWRSQWRLCCDDAPVAALRKPDDAVAPREIRQPLEF